MWCDNEQCPNHELPGHADIRFKRRYGAQPTQLLYQCRACGHTFSLRKHTALFGSNLPDEVFFRIVSCLGEGNGIRGTARINHVKTDAVLGILKRVGKHAERVFNHHLKDLHPNEVQLDELWSFLRKKEKNLHAIEALQKELGDCWVWVAFDPGSKVVLGFVLGKRTKDRCVRLLKRVHEVLGADHLPLFTSDELSSYEDAIVEVFGVTVRPEREGDVGRLPKPRRVPDPGLNYAVVHKERERNRVVRVTRGIRLGSEADIEDALSRSQVSTKVNTSFVERQNGKLRADNGRLVRKTLGFSKDKSCFRNGLSLTLAYDHYCRPHKGLRQRLRGRPPKSGKRWHHRSPMMALGKTDHVWSVRELLLHRYPGRNVRCFYGSG